MELTDKKPNENAKTLIPTVGGIQKYGVRVTGVIGKPIFRVPRTSNLIQVVYERGPRPQASNDLRNL